MCSLHILELLDLRHGNIGKRTMAEFERARDRNLLKRFQAGDRDAFTDLYQIHQKSVFRFASLMTGDRVQAADATQDVFVWLIHHPGGFDPDRGELGSFLLGVTRNVLRRKYSERRRWVQLDEAAADSVIYRGGLTSNSDDVEKLRRAVAALPERYRAVVVLCDLEEKTYEQAAAVMECAVGTVRSRLHRARELLTRKLVGNGRGCAAV
jgi:RNA polymerase sigma-70 factor (ECF subfamily)